MAVKQDIRNISGKLSETDEATIPASEAGMYRSSGKETGKSEETNAKKKRDFQLFLERSLAPAPPLLQSGVRCVTRKDFSVSHIVCKTSRAADIDFRPVGAIELSVLL